MKLFGIELPFRPSENMFNNTKASTLDHWSNLSFTPPLNRASAVIIPKIETTADTLPSAKSAKIPYRPARFQMDQIQNRRSLSSKSAGFTPGKGTDREVFDELFKRKALQHASSKVKIRDPIGTINNRWETMMQNDKLVEKTKRSISFNETVKCHSILRIQDLIEEYDAFEQTVPDTNPSHSGTIHHSKNIPDQVNIKVSGLIPDQVNIEDQTSLDTKSDSKDTDEDDSSVTSLGPGCPTPRNMSPLLPLTTLKLGIRYLTRK